MKENQNQIKQAMDIIRQAMIDDNPGEPGSYAHSWHCNIAMAFYDSIPDDKELSEIDWHAVANKGASRFMKMCFDVDTKQ